LLLLAALLLTLAVVAPLAAANNKPLAPNAVGAKAYWYIDQLTRVTDDDGTYIPLQRKAGTPSEVAAADKVAAWFGEAGYQAVMQPFTYANGSGTTYSSQNVVAWRSADLKRKGRPTPLVIVGAHYDASTRGEGADDNASGVGVMLEVAERLAHYKIDYDIVFVAFGAEEVGLKGSAYFASQLAATDVERSIAMINFDSLIVGDKLYIHAGANEKTWARDAMLRLIRLRKLPIEMQPGLNPHYPAGLTPDGFSDYTAFNQAGIPVVAFESTNWELDDLDGYTQTEEWGSFWHTSKDTLQKIEELYPGRPMVRLHAYTTVTFEFLKHLNP
jgi:Zn-dependent M28 family amino/carboxypeptidase